MMYDLAKSIQDYSLKVSGPSKAPDNSVAASLTLFLEAQST